MARRNASTKDTVETEATAPESTDTESQDQVTEQTEGTEAQAEATPASTEPDLTAFKAAAEQAVEDSDPDMGTLPLAAVDAVSTEYRKLEGQKAKNAAKNWVEESIREAIGVSSDMRKARAFVEMRNALAVATASKASAPKEPVDPTIGYANRLASLQLALSIVGNDVPDGADADKANEQAGELVEKLSEDVEKYRTWLNAEGDDKGDKPEVSPVVVAAFKLATGKASGSVRSASSGGGSTYSGPRRDVGKHIAEYFADKEEGHFAKISEIAKFKSTEYGEDHPSQGAVTAHVFNTKTGEPKTREGFEGVAPTGDEPKGIRKIA